MTVTKTESLRLYERLYVAARDLSLANQYAEFLLKKGWHAKPWERRGSIYMQQSAFTTALIVSYGRPFTNSNGWPRFPPALLKFDHEQQALHFKLIKLRHQVYAHSDSISFKVRPVENVEGTHIDILGEPFRRLEAQECQKIITMTENVVVNINKKLAKLRPTVTEMPE